jgi:nucleoside-diphosphate-sugar epimerase
MRPVDLLAGKCVLVTGGAGFLGSEVVKELATRDVADVVVPRSAACALRERVAIRSALDDARPDVVAQQPRRWLDTTRAEHEFGLCAHTPLRDGLERTIEWYRAPRRAGTHSGGSTASPERP